MSAEPLSDIKDKVQYCFGGEHAIGRGIFHLPEQDPLAPPKYVSVRSQQVISLILVVLVFLVNVLAIRVAIFTNDVCEGAGRIFIALMFLSLLTSAIMCVHSTWLPAISCPASLMLACRGCVARRTAPKLATIWVTCWQRQSTCRRSSTWTRVPNERGEHASETAQYSHRQQGGEDGKRQGMVAERIRECGVRVPSRMEYAGLFLSSGGSRAEPEARRHRTRAGRCRARQRAR